MGLRPPERGTARLGATAIGPGSWWGSATGGQACGSRPASIMTAVLEVEHVQGRPWLSALKDGIHTLFWGYRDAASTEKELVTMGGRTGSRTQDLMRVMHAL